MKTTRFVDILKTLSLLCTVSMVVRAAAASTSYIAAQGHAPSLSATNQSSHQTEPGDEQAVLLADTGELRLWGVNWDTGQTNGALGQHPVPMDVEPLRQGPNLNLVKEADPLDGLRNNGTLTFTLTLSGAGLNGVLWDPLPESVNYVESSVTEPASLDFQAKAITWQGTLASDSSLTVRSQDTPTISIYLPLIRRAGWDIILEDDFEGPWPGPWELDYNPGTNPYLWAKRDCRPYRGGYSAWVAGSNSGSFPSCGANYPDNLLTYMMYGPFSLEGAAAAELTFQLWLNSMLGQDEMYWGAALNGEDFYGFFLSGNSSGWEGFSLDLRYLPYMRDLTGEPQVWIVLAFVSDASGNLPEGAYVDDVVLRKTSLMPEGVIWREFSFFEVGTPARGCAPADPDAFYCTLAPNAEPAGAPPWTLSIPPEGATLRVTDGWWSGDVFDVYDFGNWIGRTSALNLEAECLDPDTCYRNPGMSSGEFPLAAGQHSITFVPSSAQDYGAAFFRVD